MWVVSGAGIECKEQGVTAGTRLAAGAAASVVPPRPGWVREIKGMKSRGVACSVCLGAVLAVLLHLMLLLFFLDY